MRRILLLLGFLISVGQLTRAQSIEGYVLFETDKSPVQYGNVVLHSLPDSGFVSGVITYDKGQFTLENVQPGNYVLKCSYMGFEETIVPVEVTNGDSRVVVDTAYLSEEVSKIEEVQVTADYIRGKELVDRTVYTIPPEVAESSTNGYEVLRKLPSVQVDFNNNITLDGSSNFIIQVDGKQRNKEFLARLQPGDIKSIEIIHNPSGKYDGSIDGVINVILNPEARQGVSGNVAIVVKPFNKPFAFGNAGLDYGREKVTFYLSGYAFQQNLNNNSVSKYRLGESSGLDSLINTNGDGDFSISASAINTGFDYYIDDKHNLSFNYSYKPSKMKTDLDNLGDIYVNNVLSYNQEYLTSNNLGSGESTASLYFKKEFKKPIQEFTFETDVYMFSSDEDNSFATLLYPAGSPGTADTIGYLENILNNRRYAKSKFDYVHPLGVSMRLETGYQFYYQDMEFDTKNTDISLSNLFKYDELRNAVYLSWMWNVKKFGLMATLRVEHSDIMINDTTSDKYFTFLPSTNIQYKISGSQNVKFTYNRRITRPGIYQLNPFIKLNNYQNITSGNPFLEPEHRDKVQLTYSINFKKNFLKPFVYHTILSKKISDVSTLEELPNGLFVTRTAPENVLTGYEQGIGVNSMLWFVKLDGKIFRGHYDEYTSSTGTLAAQDYSSYNLTGFVFAPVKKDVLTVYAFLMYQGVRYEAQRKIYSNPVYGLGGQYKLKNHTFGVNYVFPGMKTYTYNRTVTDTPDIFYETSNNFDVSAFVQFIYSYSFKKGKSVKKIGHKTNVESDTKSGGIQN